MTYHSLKVHGAPTQSSQPFFPTPPLLPQCLTTETATVQKIITEILASSDSTSVAFARDARDLLIECCVEFITLISSEANDIMERESKKTISIEHIDKALRELGFPEYVKEVLASAGDAKEMLKVRSILLSLKRAQGMVAREGGSRSFGD